MTCKGWILLFKRLEMLAFRAEWFDTFDRLAVDVPIIVAVWERNSTIIIPFVTGEPVLWYHLEKERRMSS